MRTRTIAYVRVSTRDQADHGVSLDAQRAKVEAYASLYELDLIEVIVDGGHSAKTLDRPGLRRALQALREGNAEALLVVKLDRLTRSVRDLGDLVETYFAPGKAALLSVSEQIDTRTAGGRLVLNVLASVSQWEREVISERTSTALRHKRSKGQKTGGHAPYGFDVVNGRLEPNAREQATIALVRQLAESGLSQRAIVAQLAVRGIGARNGKAFQKTQIARMLEREPVAA